MSQLEKLQVPSALVMKAVIIYDELVFFTNATAKLQRVGCQPDIDARWVVRGLPIKALEETARAERRLVDAANAHLIVISGRHAQTVPFRLRVWIERWAGLRQAEDAALAVIADQVHADLTNRVSPELTMLVQNHGLKFIIDPDWFTADATKLPLPPARRFSETIKGDSFRDFGINE